MSKKKYFINKKNINSLDKYFLVSNKAILEKEIENIVDNIWSGTGKFEEILKPLCISHLNITWLRRLYIYYFSIKNLKKEYGEIVVEDDFYILKIFKDEFDLKILSGGKKLDSQFYLENYLQWVDYSKTNLMKKCYKKLIFFIKKFQKLDIIYLNAGKLEKDFNLLKNTMNADFIERKNNILNKKDVTFIQKQVRKNIKNMNVSISKKILERFFEDKLIKFIPDLLSHIYSTAEFIKRRNIKLAIISTPSHDKHLSLFIASKISKIPCLLLGHGLAGTINPFLDNSHFYNAKISDIEYNYDLADNLSFKPKWFYE